MFTVNLQGVLAPQHPGPAPEDPQSHAANPVPHSADHAYCDSFMTTIRQLAAHSGATLPSWCSCTYLKLGA